MEGRQLSKSQAKSLGTILLSAQIRQHRVEVFIHIPIISKSFSFGTWDTVKFKPQFNFRKQDVDPSP